MSMLAGPRRKQKVINLRAKNNEWSNDANKFGQRMLEKMGWSSGKGLGAKENGIVEHVVARYKNDDKGLGFEDKNDQWTKHEDDFNALLANLSNDNSNEEKLHSGVSLEVMSKKSKARIHYHKFTRGKDIARYSEKDLANIFGKKTLKNVEMPVEVLKDIKTTEQVFTDKGSMEDYFKSKLTAFRSKNSGESTLSVRDEGDSVFQGFSQNDDESQEITTQGFGNQSFSFYNEPVNELESDKHIDNLGSCETIKKSKKNKKSKKSREKFKDVCETDDIVVEDANQENGSENNSKEEFIKELQEIKTKKTKKKKILQQYDEEVEDAVPKKKKCKQTRNHENEIVVNVVTEEINPENCSSPNRPKKKKKKK